MALRMIEGFSFVLSNEEGRNTYKYPFTSYHSLVAHTGGVPNDFIKGATSGLGIPGRNNYVTVSGTPKPNFVGYLSRQRDEVGFIDTRHFGEYKTWIVGEAVYFTGIMPSPKPSSTLLSFYGPSGIHCGVGVDTGGHIYAFRGSGIERGEHLISSSNTMATGRWYYVETKVHTDNLLGSIEVKVNEFTWLKMQNIDTRYSATDGISLMRFHAPRHFFIDDIYVCDGSGSVHDDFLGDCEVDYLEPRSTGYAVMWSGATGPLSFKPALLDEHDLKLIDGPTPFNDYVFASSFINQDGEWRVPRDTYVMTPLSSSGYSIIGVDVHSYSKERNANLPVYARHVQASQILPATGAGIQAWPTVRMDNHGQFHELDYVYGSDVRVRETGVFLHGWDTIMINNRAMDERPPAVFTSGNIGLTQFGFMLK